MRILIALFIIVIAVIEVKSQNLDGSINWGNVGSLNGDNRLSGGLVNDPNWGVLPSNQNRNVDIWGNNRNTTEPRQRRTRVRDAFGNLLLTDANGNVLTDANGVPMIDSVALNLGLSIDPPPPSLPPPPDDPLDVPLDGGVVILLIIAVGWGFKYRKLMV